MLFYPIIKVVSLTPCTCGDMIHPLSAIHDINLMSSPLSYTGQPVVMVLSGLSKMPLLQEILASVWLIWITAQ